MNHWIIRIGDGKNFINSSNKNIWGINSNNSNNKYFLKYVKKDDILWFIKNKSNGKILAMATFKSVHKRELEPLINLTLDNTELGWDNISNIDIEIHYENLYNLNNCNLLTNIRGMSTIRKYDINKIYIDLDNEYNNIIKYSSISNNF
jgi:hypothetical protein